MPTPSRAEPAPTGDLRGTRVSGFQHRPLVGAGSICDGGGMIAAISECCTAHAAPIAGRARSHRGFSGHPGFWVSTPPSVGAGSTRDGGRMIAAISEFCTAHSDAIAGRARSHRGFAGWPGCGAQHSPLCGSGFYPRWRQYDRRHFWILYRPCRRHRGQSPLPQGICGVAGMVGFNTAPLWERVLPAMAAVGALLIQRPKRWA